LLAVLLWLAGALSSEADSTRVDNVRATRSYLIVEVGVYRALLVNTHRGVVAGEEVAARLRTECPGVAQGAPRGTTMRANLGFEAVYAGALAFFGPDRPAVEEAVHTLSHLLWSNRGLTTLVHLLAAEHSQALIPVPDVCADWKAWVASGYKVLPTGTARLLAQIEPTMDEPELAERIAPLLKPYEGPRETALHRRLNRLRKLIKRPDAGLLRVVRKIEMALGLEVPNPTGAGPGALLIPPPPSVVQADGKRLEQFYAGRAVAAQSGCLACHRIGEYGNSGPGPDLTHIASRLSGLAIARTLVRPTAPMPSFRRLPKAKFNALVEFLSLLH
jgi:mono/diheme cytochrome c family protein